MSTVAERFWSRVDKSGECWLWTGGGHPYGVFWFDGRNVGAHRVAWMLANGMDAGEFEICHTCDVRRCCRPEHLFRGTAKQNSEDMVRKGRSARGERSAQRQHPQMYCGKNHWKARYPERIPVGSKAPHVRLTEAQVLVIREKYAAGGTTLKELGAEYGVCLSAIHHIVSRKNWRHI